MRIGGSIRAALPSASKHFEASLRQSTLSLQSSSGSTHWQYGERPLTVVSMCVISVTARSPWFLPEMCSNGDIFHFE